MQYIPSHFLTGKIYGTGESDHAKKYFFFFFWSQFSIKPVLSAVKNSEINSQKVTVFLKQFRSSRQTNEKLTNE